MRLGAHTTGQPVIPTNISLTGRFDSELDPRSGFDHRPRRLRFNTPLERAQRRPNSRRDCRNDVRRCCRNCREGRTDQAKGMLILLYGVDDQPAFDTLRRHSHTNIELRALAEQLVSSLDLSRVSSCWGAGVRCRAGDGWT